MAGTLCIFRPVATAFVVFAAVAAGASADPGDILWRTTAPTAALGGGVSVSPEGNVYWQTPANVQGTPYGIRAFRPDGMLMFTAPEAGEEHIAFDASGHLYGVHNDGELVVVALDRETGARQWRTPVPAGLGFLGGVDIGPDGNIYVCSNGGYIEATGSLTSLTPAGDIRWSHKGFFKRGGLASDIAFIDDLVIKVENTTPVDVGPFGSSGGMYAMEAESGKFAWWLPQGVSSELHRSPVVDQDRRRVYTTKLGEVWIISPEGELLETGGYGDALTIGSDGSLYSAAPGALKMDPDLNIIWQRTSGIPTGWASRPVLSPDESLMAVGYSVAPFMGEDTAHIVVLRPGNGAEVMRLPFRNFTGLSADVKGMAFSEDSSILYICIVYGDIWPGASGFYRAELVAVEMTNPGLDLEFTRSAPPLVPSAGALVEIEITAAAGFALDTSSPTLWYDAGGGWDAKPLEPVGGGRFQAVLPAAECAEPIRYYVSAADTAGTEYTEPRFAPRYVLDAVTGAGVGSTTLIDETFEFGLPAGWSATGLWHVTSACSPGPPCDGSTSFAYYGIDTTCSYVGPDPWAVEKGSLRLPPVDLTTLPAGGRAELTFCYNLDAHIYYDTRDVVINGVVARPLVSTVPWTSASVDLSPYAGEVIDIEFVMTPREPAWEPFHGMQIDSVRVEAEGVVCDICRADLTADGQLDFFDFLAFQNLFAAGEPQADFTGDGVLDFFDFLAFQGEFARGCP